MFASSSKRFLLRVVDKNTLQSIHEQSLQLLARAGVIFDNESILNRFYRKGQKVEGKRVYLSEALVSEALEVTPKSFSMAYAADASANDMHWKHKRFNNLLVGARGELDQNKRKEMYREMQQIVRDEGVVVIPMIANMVDAASDKVKFDKPAGNQELDGLRICERWWFA